MRKVDSGRDDINSCLCEIGSSRTLSVKKRKGFDSTRQALPPMDIAPRTAVLSSAPLNVREAGEVLQLL